MANSSRSGVTHTGVPPFATSLPDSAYRSQQQSTGRRPAQPPVQGRPTSAYDHYTDMLDTDDSAAGIGAGFMNADATSDDDDSDDEEAIKRARSKQSMLAEAIQHERHAVSIPLASPRPGYAGKPAVLNPPTPASPPQQQQRQPPGLRAPAVARAPPNQQRNGPYPGVDVDKKDPNKLNGGWADTNRQISPAPPYAANMLSAPQQRPGVVSIAPSIPMTPQMTAGSLQPIQPAFINNRDSVRFNEESTGFIRGGAEGMVIPRRGARGDHFWRRFSVIAKDKGNNERSSWLKLTQRGTKSLSRGVWLISLILVICIAGGIGAGWYFGHNDTSHTAPKALGGSDANGQIVPTSSTKSVKIKSTSSALHVSPTNTVARRAAIPIPSAHAQRRTILR